LLNSVILHYSATNKKKRREYICIADVGTWYSGDPSSNGDDDNT
jgi:hypothetical protein